MKCPAIDPQSGLGCLNVKGHSWHHVCSEGTWDNEERFPTRPCAVQYENEEHVAFGCYLAVGHPGPHQIRLSGETINWISQYESDNFVSLEENHKTQELEQ